MTESGKCSRCGAALPADAPGGHCLQCLLQLGLASEETSAEEAAEVGDSTETARSESRALPLAEKPGDRIGHYKLLQQIGEGGCGVVYMAEQEQPVRRRVALKIIKLGMDTRSVIARFEAERQALAMMDHPNIAKVLDAGATPTGRPYFVMELVRGVKITDYCDELQLSTRQRLDLFIPACQAIQHAHQKGVIHRDIKPSNILVTEQDGAPVPKIIDFGIAKATTDQRLTDKTLFTAFEQFVGTPAYMSPEQAGLGGLDIDTRSDIYSLGVLLYELLTGHPPFDLEGLRRSALDEILRVIRDNEPPRPSARFTTLTEQELTTVAQHRQIESAKLPHLLRGDLDWIVMKALEKDRARRYDTANGLAMDIQRHLDNEPVVARPPSAAYRFQKLVRRNRIAVAATSAVAAALFIGLGVSTWMFIKERADRQRAVASEQRAETVSQFLKDMLQGVRPSVALGQDTKMLRGILDKTAERISKDLTNQPEAEMELRHTLTKTYYELGVNVEAMAREDLRLARTRLGEEHPAVSQALGQLGFVMSGRGDRGNLAQAETLIREALTKQKKLSGNEGREVATLLEGLGAVLRHQGKLSEAEKVLRESLEMRKKLLGSEHWEVARGLNQLGLVLSLQGKLAEAEPLLRQALAMDRKLLGNEHPEVASSLHNLAFLLRDEGKLADAEPMFREAVAMSKKLYGNEHPRVALALNCLATVLSLQDKRVEAEPMFREGLAMDRKLLGNEHPEVTSTLVNLAMLLQREGKLVEAESMLREALTIVRSSSATNPSPEVPLLGSILHHLAEVLHERKAPTEARPLAEEAVALYRRHTDWPLNERKHALEVLDAVLTELGDSVGFEAMLRAEEQGLRARFPAGDPDLAYGLWHLVDILLKEKKFVEAEPLARESLAIREKKIPNDWPTFNSRSVLGGSLLRQKKYTEAEPLLLSGYEGMKKREGKILANHATARIKEALQRLVQLYEATGRSDQAAEWKQKLAELQKTEK